MHVSHLFLHPVKGAQGVSVSELEIEPRGPRGDRRWMVVDAAGKFMTQRGHPRLVLIRAALSAGSLDLEAPGLPPLHVVEPGPSAPRQRVEIWRDALEVPAADDAAHAWLSRFLGVDARLVFMDAAACRPVDPAYAGAEDEVSFADGFPLLLMAEASLEALNTRLEVPVTMRRFRPNLVVAGSAAFEEDGWKELRIGEATFRVVKPCERCAVTTVDPESGVVGREPLRTLATFRRRGGKVYFGQNLIPSKTGTIRVGEAVEVVL